jgi:H+/Cl- antiporter ClcA
VQAAPAPAEPPDPQALLRSRTYVQLLILAALVGVPVSAASYGFLALADWLQGALFTDLPKSLGFDAAPVWWPLPLLTLSGLLVALAIRHLPGTGGHSPADGFHTSGPVPPVQLPGIFFASLATLAFGVVLGPEAPLILMGSSACWPSGWRRRTRRRRRPR